MSTLELIQGSPEWKAARCGSLGASRIADAVARIKTGYGASRANLMAELLTERLTGTPTEGFMNDAMRWGQEHEAEARAAYSFRSDADVIEVGLITHPNINGTHASPDGLIGDDGMVEIKCPQSATHIETLLGGQIADKYFKQMQWQMACAARVWCDFVSYDPRLPEEMRLHVTRVMRSDPVINGLSGEVIAFLVELNEKVATLRARYLKEAA